MFFISKQSKLINVSQESMCVCSWRIPPFTALYFGRIFKWIIQSNICCMQSNMKFNPEKIVFWLTVIVKVFYLFEFKRGNVIRKSA